MTTIRNFLLGIFLLLTASLSYAQTINATASTSGTTDSLNLTTSIYPTSGFIGNGSKAWIALLRTDGSLWFNGGPGGFVQYLGGDAPAYTDINSGTVTIAFQGWGTRPILGGDVYVGYGYSFQDMLNNGRYKKVHTLVDVVAALPAGYLSSLDGSLSSKYVTITALGSSCGTPSQTQYGYVHIAVSTTSSGAIINLYDQSAYFTFNLNYQSGNSKTGFNFIGTFDEMFSGVKSVPVVVNSLLNTNSYPSGYALAGLIVYYPKPDKPEPKR